MPQRFTTIRGEIYLGPDWLFETRTRENSRDNLYVNVSNNPGGNNPLGVSHFSISGGLQNGFAGGFTYKNNPSGFYDRSYYAKLSDQSLDSTANYGNRFAAATNPGRPAVRLPVFLAELRDIPAMVKEMGAIGIAIRDKGAAAVLRKADTRSLAKTNLAVQFGWRPFVQDLWKMATLTDAVEKRMKELEKVRRKGGSTRRITLEKYGATQVIEDDLGKTTVTSTVTVKAGGKWFPTYSGSADRTPEQVRRILLGADAGNIASNVWEALPWTWFTDQFQNIGQMLEAGNRTVATLERAWITTVWETTARNPGGGQVSPCQMHNLRIERFPTSPSNPTASFPTLGAGQLSILGSLAVSKNRKVLWH